MVSRDALNGVAILLVIQRMEWRPIDSGVLVINGVPSVTSMKRKVDARSGGRNSIQALDVSEWSQNRI